MGVSTLKKWGGHGPPGPPGSDAYGSHIVFSDSLAHSHVKRFTCEGLDYTAVIPLPCCPFAASITTSKISPREEFDDLLYRTAYDSVPIQ